MLAVALRHLACVSSRPRGGTAACCRRLARGSSDTHPSPSRSWTLTASLLMSSSCSSSCRAQNRGASHLLHTKSSSGSWPCPAAPGGGEPPQRMWDPRLQGPGPDHDACRLGWAWTQAWPQDQVPAWAAARAQGWVRTCPRHSCMTTGSQCQRCPVAELCLSS